MIVDIRRLERVLKANGFEIGWQGRDDGSALTRRSATSDELTELVLVGWAGKRGEAVFADVGVSVLRRWPTKGLVETEQLVELDDDKARRWTILHTREDAEKWETKLAHVASDRCRDCATRLGPALLERTESARRAASDYVSRVPNRVSAEDALRSLRQICSPAEVTRADELRRWPGVLQIHGGELVYDIAALLVVHFAFAVESESQVAGMLDPLRDPELMWRLQLVRDHLADLWPDAIAAA